MVLTMRARKLLIWLGLIVLGVPLALALLSDISTVIDHIELVASLLLILSLSVAGWRLKKRLKKRMGRGLGREIEDYELTSITTWMRIPDQAARASREAEKYDFND
jgi:membrane protein implicated in regulation of membrane protease activity